MRLDAPQQKINNEIDAPRLPKKILNLFATILINQHVFPLKLGNISIEDHSTGIILGTRTRAPLPRTRKAPLPAAGPLSSPLLPARARSSHHRAGPVPPHKPAGIIKSQGQLVILDRLAPKPLIPSMPRKILRPLRTRAIRALRLSSRPRPPHREIISAPMRSAAPASMSIFLHAIGGGERLAAQDWFRSFDRDWVTLNECVRARSAAPRRPDQIAEALRTRNRSLDFRSARRKQSELNRRLADEKKSCRDGRVRPA